MDELSPSLFIEFSKRQIHRDGRLLELSPRFADLILYLAAMRVADPLRGEGFVECQQILNIPSWSRNQALSVGKQISRWVKESNLEHGPLIESRQRVYGPFRIALPPDQIELGAEPEEIIAELTLADSKTALGSKRGEEVFEFSRHYWQGVNCFDNGKLSQAREAFEKAIGTALVPQQRLAASFYLRRILERTGDLEEADRLRGEAAAWLEGAGRYQCWAEARDMVLSAWRLYRDEEFDAAERLYRKALLPAQAHGFFQIMGDIRNGLGEIAKQRGNYPEAIRQYLEALDVWLLSDYFYGFQAVYFNIGVVYRLWGDQLSGRSAAAARQKYELAAEWTERCIELCRSMNVGLETSEAEAQLCSLYVKLGRHVAALRTGLVAQTMAFFSGNQRSILASTRALVGAYLARNKPEQAGKVLERTSRSLSDRFREILARDFLKFLR